MHIIKSLQYTSPMKRPERNMLRDKDWFWPRELKPLWHHPCVWLTFSLMRNSRSSLRASCSGMHTAGLVVVRAVWCTMPGMGWGLATGLGKGTEHHHYCHIGQYYHHPLIASTFTLPYTPTVASAISFFLPYFHKTRTSMFIYFALFQVDLCISSLVPWRGWPL